MAFPSSFRGSICCKKSNVTHMFQMGWFNHQLEKTHISTPRFFCDRISRKTWCRSGWCEVLGWAGCVKKDVELHMGVSSKIGVPQNGWFIMENPIKMDDLGIHLFSETSISCWNQLSNGKQGTFAKGFLATSIKHKGLISGFIKQNNHQVSFNKASYYPLVVGRG